MSDGERIVIPAETTVAIIALLVGLLTLTPLPVGGFYDDGLYVILAKALATGQGYHFLNLPGAPAAVHYPPGYPMLLALLWKLAPEFPGNVMWFKVVNVLLLGVIAWVTCRYAVRVLALPAGVAVVATLLGTITIPILVLTAMVVSEPLFLALAIPALILGEEAARRRPGRREAVWLGVLSGVVVLVRSVGILLPIAVLVVWCTRRHWRAAAWYAGATLLVVSPWLLWTGLHAGDVPAVLRGTYGSYAGWFLGGLHEGGLPFLVATIRTNAHTLVLGTATSFRFAVGTAWTLLTEAALVLLFLYGAWRVRRRAPVTLLFLGLYLSLVLAWPAEPLRFVWGVWPLLMALLLVPLEVVRLPDVRRPLRIAVAVLALVLVPGVVRYNARGFRGNWWENIPRSGADRAEAAARWVRVNTRRDDVIAAEADPSIYLYSGRRAVPVATYTALQYLRPRTVAQDAGYLRRIVAATGARYVLIQSMSELAVARAMAADTAQSPSLAPIDSTPALMAFRVTPVRPVAEPAANPGAAPADSVTR
ncbi:MAG TPA: hypothetical protein VFK16_05055 [Gemmatimonadaceae bacterium]|nr:hypothetical protein [Gemmatimonadaceae bacterium]